ncbi:SGNH hydrolase superfamily [Sesbania bispinosa]|nr:SGNH hydrolase superfamily [Sesbania bispinosa]
MKQFKTKVDEAGHKELYNLGGRTFMVLNLAPVGCYPSFLVELPHDSSDLDDFGCMVSYNNAVVDYNNMLKQTLTQTRQSLSDASVIYVDTPHCSGSNMVQKHVVDMERVSTTSILKFTAAIPRKNGTLAATACNDPYNYVSWDGIHATEAANKLTTYAILNGSYYDPPFPFQERCDLQPIG